MRYPSTNFTRLKELILSKVSLCLLTYIVSEPLFWLIGLRERRGEIKLSDIKRVLVVRVDRIGDAILTSPFLRELRKNVPGAKITLVVSPEVYNLVQRCPYTDEILTYDWKTESRFGRFILFPRILKLAIFHLWKRKFELAILPRRGEDIYYGSLLAYLSGAKKIFSYPESVIFKTYLPEAAYEGIFKNLETANPIMHETEYSLEILKFIGGSVEDGKLELWIDADDDAFVQSVLKDDMRNSCLLIGLGLGARDSKRRWPKERFLEIIKWLINNGCYIALLGDDKEAELGSYIESSLEDKSLDKVINLCGKTTLRQVASILKYCKLYIGNDTGLMHIASAQKIPIVEISCWPKSGDKFSSNSIPRFGPWQTRYIVVNPENPLYPCHGECSGNEPHCILLVEIQEVKQAINKILFRQTDEK